MRSKERSDIKILVRNFKTRASFSNEKEEPREANRHCEQHIISEFRFILFQNNYSFITSMSKE